MAIQQGEAIYKLPLPKNDDSLDFSYSGLKSAVINLIHKMEQKNQNYKKEDIAASFLKVATDILMNKTKIALKQFPEIKTFVIAGGVAANSMLREKMEKLFEHYKNIELITPQLSLCGDNAAMIAMVAYYKILKGEITTDLSISALSTYNLENFN